MSLGNQCPVISHDSVILKSGNTTAFRTINNQIGNLAHFRVNNTEDEKMGRQHTSIEK